MSRPISAAPHDVLPILTALLQRQSQATQPFHTPGHQQGRGSPQVLQDLLGEGLALDLTELPGLDHLGAPSGPIAEAQALAAQTFGSDRTWFLVNGSTVGIMAALLATAKEGETILLPRNVHQSAISALILSGANPVFLNPDGDSTWGFAYPLKAEQVAQGLAAHPEAKAVFLVSPTYEGLCSPLGAIADVVHGYHLPLIVDEAHGSHLGFHPQLPPSALSQGADVVIQSSHKTLTALTQAAMLHHQGSRIDGQAISRCLNLLQTTSPSYLLLASLDAARQQIASQGRDHYDRLLGAIAHGWQHLDALGLPRLKDRPELTGLIDPTRLTLGTWPLGLTGFAVDEWLDQHQKITAELPSLRYLTFLWGWGTTSNMLDSFVQGIDALIQAHGIPLDSPPVAAFPLDDALTPTISQPRLTPRQGFFAPQESVTLGQSIGRISATSLCPYPPGIPLILPGEVITAGAIAQMEQILRAGGLITGLENHPLKTVSVVMF